MERSSIDDTRPYPWRVFFVLLAGSVLSILAVLPYLTVVLRPILAVHPLRLPLPLLALIQGTTNCSVAIILGLLVSRKIGLGAPVLEAWLYGRPSGAGRGLFWISCATGLGLGLVTVALIRSPLGAALTALPIASEGAMPVWKRFLACFYGGFCEEILMRLFFLSLVAWLLGKLWKMPSGLPSSGALWIANILVAVAFGAGHLPLASQLTVLTPLLVTAIISLNGIVALGFGYLYWKRGLESAMLAHFSADIVLHVLSPVF